MVYVQQKLIIYNVYSRVLFINFLYEIFKFL
jgi:hypothetical protein